MMNIEYCRGYLTLKIAGLVLLGLAIQACARRDSEAEGLGRVAYQNLSPQRLSPLAQKRETEFNLLMSRAHADLKAKRLSQAEQDYKQIIRLDPHHQFWFSDLARVYELQGRTKDAFDAWSHALAQSPRSWSSLQNDPGVLAHYGELGLLSGRPVKADEAFQSAARSVRGGGQLFTERVDIDPSDFEDAKSIRALAHYSAGTKEFLSGQKS